MVQNYLARGTKRSLTLLGALAMLSLVGQQASAQTGLGIRSGQADGLTFGVDGRLTLEAAAYLPVHKEDFGYRTSPTALPEPFRMAAGTSVTQARIAFVSGYKNWKGRIDVNFAGQRVSFCDMVIGYDFNEKTSLTLGYELDPFSIGVNTASRHSSVNTPISLDFLSRPERHWGITAIHSGKHYWLSGGVYAGGISRQAPRANHQGEGYGFSMRAVYRPINTAERTLHFGGSFTTRAPEKTHSDTGLLGVSVHPGSTVDGREFISGSLNGVYRFDLLGGEVAYRDNRFFFQGEYLYAGYHADPNKVPPLIGGINKPIPELTEFYGGYLTGSVMLRGKQRVYQSGSATFKNVNPELAPGGNIELMGRLGYLDAKEAGRALEGLAAVNWYPNQLMMLGLSYTYTGMNAQANAGGTLVPLGHHASDGLKLHTLQLRAQFVF